MASVPPPLAGVRVIEFAGLAPVPYCGTILRQFGCDVVRIDRMTGGPQDQLGLDKRSVAMNTKNPEGKEALLRMIEKADVVLDTFRPGVLEKLGLSPEKVLLKRNPRLIVARVTGWGQTGAYAQTAGHDIAYLSLTGVLSMFARSKTDRPLPPVNLLGDFAGGGMLAAFGIVLALLERERSGLGQVVDSAMVDGVAHFASFIYRWRAAGMWSDEPGTNTLDSAAPFYDTYACKGGEQFIAVGAIEPQFFAQLVEGLGIADHPNLPNYQNDREGWPAMRKLLTETIASRTRDEWSHIFRPGGPYQDACVSPILTMAEAAHNQHMKDRRVFTVGPGGPERDLVPNPAPLLMRTPGVPSTPGTLPEPGQHTREVLAEYGFSADEIARLEAAGAVEDNSSADPAKSKPAKGGRGKKSKL